MSSSPILKSHDQLLNDYNSFEEHRNSSHEKKSKIITVSAVTISMIILLFGIDLYMSTGSNPQSHEETNPAFSVAIGNRIWAVVKSILLYLSSAGVAAGAYLAKNTCFHGELNTVWSVYSGPLACNIGVAIALVCGSLIVGFAGFYVLSANFWS